MEKQVSEAKAEAVKPPRYETTIAKIKSSPHITDADKAKAEKAIRKMAEAGNTFNLSSDLEKMFVFSRTEEGHDFWRSIEHKLNNPAFYETKAKEE